MDVDRLCAERAKGFSGTDPPYGHAAPFFGENTVITWESLAFYGHADMILGSTLGNLVRLL